MVVVDTPEQFDRTVALILAAQLVEKPNCALGMATGTTTIGPHRELVNLYREGLISFKQAYTFNLDVRYGLPLLDKDAMYLPMKDNLFDHVDIPIEHGCFPDSMADDPQAGISEFVRKIESVGGIDLQVLPFGENGHIGFCQPGTKLGASAVVCPLPPEYVVPLAQEYGGLDKVPSIGLTLGPADIMKARKILFCAKGLRKAEIAAKALKGPVTEDVPASIVQLHPNVIVVLDREAASKL
jgi:glucosamine-6-phosphate deaminase